MTAYSDSFDLPDTTKLPLPWSQTAHGVAGIFTDDFVSIVSKKVRPTTVNASAVQAYLAAPKSADQFSYAEIATFTGADAIYSGTMVRMQSPPVPDGYFASASRNDGGGNTTFIIKQIADVQTTLSNEAATTWAANDSIYIEAIGITLKVKRNGTVMGALTTTDSAVADGFPGLNLYIATGAVSQVEFDNFKGGTFALDTRDLDESKFPHPILRAPLQQGRLL